MADELPEFTIESSDGVSSETVSEPSLPEYKVETLPEFIQNREGEEEGAITEIGEGIVSGLIGIGQGIGELGASAIDLIADTDYASDVTESADALRAALGVDPEGLAGSIAEIGTQFVLPGLGAASAVSKLSKLGKLSAASRVKAGAVGPVYQMSRSQKLALGAQQAAAAGAADAIVATDNIRTIGDFFEGGPTMTDREIGLSGREEAARRILNKAKIGAEGLGLAATVPVALSKAISGTAAATGAATKAVAGTDTAQAVGKALQVPGKKVGEKMADIEARVMDPGAQVSAFENFIYNTRAALTPRGALPQEVSELRFLIPGMTEAQVRTVGQRFARFDKELTKFEKSLPKERLTDFHRQEMYDSLFEFMSTGNREVLKRMPEQARAPALLMRKQINDLSTSIKDSNLLRIMDKTQTVPAKGEKTADQIRQIIDTNMDSYLRRRYRMFTDASYKPDAKTLKIGKDGFLNDPKATFRELKFIIEKGSEEQANAAKRFLNDDETFLLSSKVRPEAADLAVEGFLRRHQPKTRMSTKSKDVAKDRLNVSLIKDRKDLKEFERRLLGEVTDAREAVLGTISDLANFRAVDAFQGGVRSLAQNNSGIGKYFVEPGKQAPEGYVRLSGPEFGVLENFMVPPRMYKDLTRLVVGQEEGLNMAFRATYGGFLKLKGMSQFSKTVLSPITQIRNVTTASLFALAQGNVGRGANLGESFHIVMKDIAKGGDEALMKELTELQELGVIGTQAQLKELQDLIKNGMSRREQVTVDGIEVGAEFGNVFRQGQLGEFYESAAKRVRPVTDKLTDYYQGGDNVWKIYNYKFEQNKIRNAFRGMSVEDQVKQLEDLGVALRKQDPANPRKLEPATQEMVERGIKEYTADIVRNTVPNYNKAPEFIKNLRQLPVGNFIAFPYEIYRTGFNTIGQGIKELSSDSAAIREIGLRRLTGASVTFAAMPVGLSAMAYELSGVSEEEMEAYKRSGAASWEKNSRLIPTGRDEDGKIKYINYSYSNPYDLLERSIQTVLNEVETGRQMDRDTGEVVLRAGFNAMRESFNSFLAPSIMTNKIADVAPRAMLGREGRTETGSRVYNPQDSVGDKMAKSFAHVIDGIMPSALPVQVRGGEFEAGRFARGLTTAVGINEALGIAPEDRRGRDYQLGTELIRAFMGVTELTADPEQNLGYKGFEFSRARTDASNIFNRAANASNATSESLLEAYIDADDARYRVYDRFHQTVEDFRTMGMSDSEIRKVLKKNKVGDINSIMRGRYQPLKPSRQTLKNMREVGSFDVYPRQEIREIQRERRNMEFSQPEPAFNDDAEMFQPIGAEPVNNSALTPPVAPPVAPQPTTMGPLADFYSAPQATSGVLTRISRQSIEDSAKARGTTPQQLIQTAGLQPVQPDASLLGDDPVTIARNMQIAQRTRRG